MKKLFVLILACAMLLSLASPAFAAEGEQFATVDALQFDAEPDIDGTVSVEEWGAATVVVKYPDNGQTAIRDSSEADALEYAVWFRYTYEGFYVAATVPDTSPHNAYADNSQCWNGDCFQMRIDPYGCTADQGLSPSATRDANYSKEYQEFAFVLGDDGTTYAYCWHGVMSGNSLSSGDGKYAASNDGTNTYYEAYIPWEELVPDGAIHAGHSLGVATCILTATDGDYENWLEWGTGVINGREENIYGTNRMMLSDKTVFGGASLEDPDPDNIMTAPVPAPEATGDYAMLDITKLYGENQLEYTVNDDGSVHFTFQNDGGDPYVTLDVISTVKVDAQTYPYLALYMKTNDDNPGEVFYHCTNSSVQGMTADQRVSMWYQYVEGNQVVVVELGDEWDWDGFVNEIRLDWYDGGASDKETTFVTLYAAAFFKTFEDAYAFAQDEITIETDPECEPLEPEETEDDDTEEKGEATTAAPEEPSDSESTAAPDQSTKPADDKTDAPAKNNWIIWVIVGVVAVAAIVVVVVIIGKKKK